MGVLGEYIRAEQKLGRIDSRRSQKTLSSLASVVPKLYRAIAQWQHSLRATGKQHCFRLSLTRSNFLQTRQRIRVSPYQKNKRSGLS
jgi:hypothetical protein